MTIALDPDRPWENNLIVATMTRLVVKQPLFFSMTKHLVAT
jgi:hypothetical protein